MIAWRGGRLPGFWVRLVMVPALALSFAAAGQAADFGYRIDLSVPQAYRKLLTDNLEIYRWQGNPRMNAAQLQRLMRGVDADVSRLMETEGYFSPDVTSSLDRSQKPWEVRITVTPGEPVRVAKVNLVFEGAIAGGSSADQERIEQLRASWSLPAGTVFRQAAWEDAKRSILQKLLADTYPAARIAASRALVNPATHEVFLNASYDSGPVFTMGDLEITGLKRYPRRVVEGLNHIAPGSPYSQAKLLELQSRLQDTPYFSNVTVTAPVDPEHAQEVPIEVSVKEMPAKKLGFGLGYSTDGGPRTQLDYWDYNLRSLGWRLHGALKLDSRSQSLGGELYLPTGEPGYQNKVTALAEHAEIQNQIATRYSFGATRTHVVGPRQTDLTLQYVTETTRVPGAQSDSTQALTANYGWTWRRVDDLLYPSKGYLLNFQVGGGTRMLLSDQDFLRGYAKGAKFISFGGSNTLILRGELGMVAAPSRNGIPSQFLFRTGGDQSVRGYAFDSLGVPEDGAIVGGRYLAVGSVEAVHWFTEKWGGAVFYDVGDAADSLGALSPASGYGAGVRWRSPVGPLNLDVAYGNRTGQIRLHFSVGVSF